MSLPQERLISDSNEIRYIPLTQGKFAIVDAEDYDWLSQYKRYAAKSGTTFYACRARGRTTVNMHREIMRAPKGMMCDHRNHNGLDNRKSNLRLCTSSQNARNQRARAGCTSKYKGVCWHKKERRWQARITCNGNHMHLGSFDNEIDAALAYDNKAVELFGEFAYLNFPERIELKNWIKKIIWAGTGGRRLDNLMRPEHPEMRFCTTLGCLSFDAGKLSQYCKENHLM